MDDDVAQRFINSVVKNLQVLCHSNVNFVKNVEVIGHLYLNVDSCTKLNYIVNEKVCKNEASSTVFVSNSFHAEVGVKKKVKEPSKPPDDYSQKSQRGGQFSQRHSLDSSASSGSQKREHQGSSFSSESKMPRLSDYPRIKIPDDVRHSRPGPFSSNTRLRHSQDSDQSVHNSPRENPIEIDLTKVKKEYSSGGCEMDGDDERLNVAFGHEPQPHQSNIDFVSAFPISLHPNQTLSSAIALHEDIGGSSHPNNPSNNNNSGAGSADFEIDQKPFVHNPSGEPQFSPMNPGGSPRLRPPWLGGEHVGSLSPASSSQQNFPDFQWPNILNQSTSNHQNISRSIPGVKKFICQICNKICVNYNQLEGHLNSHTKSKPHVCELCGKGYAYRSDLNKHKSKLCRMRPVELQHVQSIVAEDKYV